MALLDAYTSDEALGTAIRWLGGTDPNAFGSHTRLDGPQVWTEISERRSDVGGDRYCSIRFDKSLDYGVFLSLSGD